MLLMKRFAQCSTPATGLFQFSVTQYMRMGAKLCMRVIKTIANFQYLQRKGNLVMGAR